MRRRPASLSAARLRSPSGILRASAITSVARSSQKRLSGGCSAFFTVIALCLWREGLPECIGLNHHLVNLITLTSLERANIETHTCRHNASEYHVSAALWASRAMDVEVDVVRQEMAFLHNASLFEKVAVVANKNIARRQPYLGAVNWPWSQFIISLDCRGSPSFTGVLSWCEQRRHSKVLRS
jgi:hypothetical protein